MSTKSNVTISFAVMGIAWLASIAIILHQQQTIAGQDLVNRYLLDVATEKVAPETPAVGQPYSRLDRLTITQEDWAEEPMIEVPAGSSVTMSNNVFFPSPIASLTNELQEKALRELLWARLVIGVGDGIPIINMVK